MMIDTQLFFLLNSLAGRNLIIDAIIIFFAAYLPYLLIITVVVYFFYNARSNKDKIEGLVSIPIAGLIGRYLIATPLHFLYHRPRPFTTLEVNQLLTENSLSFPSGHATFFFAVSAIVYNSNKKLGIFFFTATALITISRVIAGIHYPSDILAGAFIGIACGYITLRYITPRVIKEWNESKIKQD